MANNSDSSDDQGYVHPESSTVLLPVAFESDGGYYQHSWEL